MKEKEQKTAITEATEISEIDDESIGEALREIERGECTIVSSVEEMWKALGIKL